MSRALKAATVVAVLVILGTLGLTAVAPPQADADETVEITQAGYTINQPGKYKLDADLDFSNQVNGIGIKILNVRGVELDLNGHDITGKPSQAYGGSGTGIYVIQSEDVEIDGKNSEISHCANAIRIQQSKNIDIDGENVDIENCASAIFVYKSDHVTVRKVDLENNKQRDIYFNQTKDSEIRDCDLKGPTFQGILLAQCENVVVRDTEIGKDEKIKAGIILFRSEDCTVDDCKIGRADNGVILTGADTKNTTIRKTKFGEPEDNTCDIAINDGAEAPTLDDNDPDDPTICNNPGPQ